MPEPILDFLEVLAFIVPIFIQLLLGIFTQLGWMSEALALTMYTALSYVCAASLVTTSVLVARRCVHHTALVISSETAPWLVMAIALVGLAAFSAMAPTTGISLRHCARVAADFVSF